MSINICVILLFRRYVISKATHTAFAASALSNVVFVCTLDMTHTSSSGVYSGFQLRGWA